MMRIFNLAPSILGSKVLLTQWGAQTTKEINMSLFTPSTRTAGRETEPLSHKLPQSLVQKQPDTLHLTMSLIVN